MKKIFIHQLVENQAVENPSNCAIVAGNDMVSYGNVQGQVNCLSRFLAISVSPEQSVIAFLLDNSIDLVISFYGIMKSGHIVLPIDPILPYDRILFMLRESKAKMIITNKKWFGQATKLLWECSDLKRLLCLDSLNVWDEQSGNVLMNTELWDRVGKQAVDIIEAGGWISSFTGSAFTTEEMDEYAANVATKLNPYITDQTKVLEVGCSSGITLLQVAPKVAEYYGIDISENILEFARKEIRKAGLSNVILKKMAAHQLDKVDDRNFDAIILNSVIQSFSGHNYFRKVIQKCIEKIATKGIIFCGDVQDQNLKEELIDTLKNYELKADDNVNVKTDWSNELFLSREFFHDLQSDFPAIRNIRFSNKIASIQNELTRFRFDVILEIDKNPISLPKKPVARNKIILGKKDMIKKKGEQTTTSQILPDQIAYILYTSGSTGYPKGVKISHSNIYNYVIWANSYYFEDMEVGNMALVTSISFDLTLTSLFCPLSRGKTLYIPRRENVDKALEDCLQSPIVEVLKLTPSHILMIDSSINAKAPYLKKLILGGEVVKKNHIEKALKLNSSLEIFNEYGPTETTVGSIAGKVDFQNEYWGIGIPIANTSVYILDDELELTGLGLAGEICISGKGVAKGYLNSPELNSIKFIRNPFEENKILYRTGDIGKWTEEGNLELIGRKDRQLKIRGFRIDLDEIESVIHRYPGIKQCVITSRVRNNETYLTAYYILNSQVQDKKKTLTALQLHTAAYLPKQTIPQYFQQLDTLPTLPNGKLNKAALPDPINSHYPNEDILPKNQLESQLTSIWKTVLGKDIIGRKENFFSIGGHSLNGIQIISKIHQELGIKLNLDTIFSFPTIEKIAVEISKLKTHKYEEIQVAPEGNYYELSYAQNQFLVMDRLQGFSRHQGRYTRLNIFETIDPEIFKKTLLAMEERHESLRTFFIKKTNEWKQYVKQSGSLSCDYKYLNYECAKNIEHILQDIDESDRKLFFDLEKGPLVRIRLINAPERKSVILFATHHIVMDGISFQIYIQDLKTIYDAFKSGLENPMVPLRIQYKDYSYWHNALLKYNLLEKSQQYWQNKLSGNLPILDLPTDFPRDINRDYNGGRLYNFKVEYSLIEDLSLVFEKCGITMFMGLLACLKILLLRITGQPDIIIGTPISCRSHIDLEKQIGVYLNTLPLRSLIDLKDSHHTILRKVGETATQAFTHQFYPFEKIIEDIQIKRNPTRNPLFDVGFTLNNADAHIHSDQQILEMEEDYQPVDEVQSSYDLWFVASIYSDQFEMEVKYNSRLYKPSSIKGMVSEFKNILREMADTENVNSSGKDVNGNQSEDHTKPLIDLNI